MNAGTAAKTGEQEVAPNELNEDDEKEPEMWGIY